MGDSLLNRVSSEDGFSAAVNVQYLPQQVAALQGSEERNSLGKVLRLAIRTVGQGDWREMVEHRQALFACEEPGGHRGVDAAGRNAVEQDTRSRPIRRNGSAAQPASERVLAARIAGRGFGVDPFGQLERGSLVSNQAGIDQNRIIVRQGCG